MATDNVDIFKKIIFNIPSTKKIMAAILVLGSISATLTYYSLKLFAGNLLPGGFMTPLVGIYLALLLYILPSILSAESLYVLLPDYPRKWGYFLALSNQFIFFIFALILTGANNFVNAWNVLWIGIITVYLSNLFILMLTIGYDYVKRLSVLSLVQPLTILAAFHFILGRALQIPMANYVSSMSVLVLAGVMLALIILTVEFFIGANVEGVTALWLSSGLLQKRQEELDLGYPTEPDVQTFQIENEDGETTLAVPWIHPGPLGGFGGGEVTTNIIENLNRDGSGFFLHVPSTHKADPAKPSDYRKIIDALQDPEKVSEASKLVKKRYGEVRFYGRKIDGKKIVFMDPDHQEFDDYEMSVFREMIDPEEVLLVDLHNHRRNHGERKEILYNTKQAEMLKGYLKDFLEELDDEETYPYSAGFDVDTSGTSSFALVEEVDGQETVLFGIEGNECGPEMQQLREEMAEKFDEVMPFSTDTHRSIHELSREEQVEKKKVKRNIEKARENVSPASLGFANEKAETMNLLQHDYSGLIFSINILVRFIPISLLALYIALILWVL